MVPVGNREANHGPDQGSEQRTTAAGRHAAQRRALVQRWEYIEFGAPVVKDFRLMTGLPEAASAVGAIVRDADA